MHHHIAEVYKHPLSRILAFDAQRLLPNGLGAARHVIRQGFNVATGVTAANNQGIHNIAEFAHIENYGVDRFEVFEGLNDQGRQFPRR